MATVIQPDHIKDEYKGRAETNVMLELIKSASTVTLDQGKFETIGETLGQSKSKTLFKEYKYLPRFEMESPRSYSERLIFCTNYGYTALVADSYGAVFAKAKKELQIDVRSEVLEEILENIDGMQTTLDEFATELFVSLLREGRSPVFVDKAGGMPFASILPRQSMRNFAGAFDFLTWDGVDIKVSGIAVSEIPVIHAITKEDFAIYTSPTQYELPKKLKESPNTLGYVPIYDVWLSSGVPILKPLAVFDFNIMNLDSEMRRILRNQAGLNILQLSESVDLNTLTDKSVIRLPPNENHPDSKWVTYPSGSMDSQFRYLESVQSSVFEISRLRRAKAEAESGYSKTLDFAQTDAVLNAAANVIEKAVENIVRYYLDYLGIQAKVKYVIDRTFEISTIDKDLDGLIKVIGAQLGATVETRAKMKVAKKWGFLQDGEEQKFESEQLAPSQFSENFGGL